MPNTEVHIPFVPGIVKQEEGSSAASIHVSTSNMNSASSGGPMKPERYDDSLTKASKTMSCVYNIGPPAWIKKDINASTIENQLVRAPFPFSVDMIKLGK